MTRFWLFLGLFLGLGYCIHAQTPTTISQIMTVNDSIAPNDTSVLKGGYVSVRGVVVQSPKEWYQYFVPGSASFWIQDSAKHGSKTGLQVRISSVASAQATGAIDLLPGQYVEVIGTVGYYSGETQLTLDTLTTVTVLANGIPLAGPDTLQLITLNSTSTTSVPTGEEWQGSYISIKDASVIQVSTNPARGDFTVRDASGGEIKVWDAYFFQRNQTHGYTKPELGTVYSEIRGIVFHRAFLPTSYYELHVFDTLGMTIGQFPPNITSMVRNIACPKPTDSITVTATIDHIAYPADSVVRANVRYAIGETNLNYDSIPMTKVPGSTNQWTATIPPQPNQTFVHYYVTATDLDSQTVSFPIFAPQCYTTNQNGCEIVDIQKTSQEIQRSTSRRYESGYVDMHVSDVQGVVTASVNDLGYIFIQQEGKNAWAGIQLIGDTSITKLKIGDKVSVNGKVTEYFGHTQITEATANVISTGNSITPLVLSATQFSDTQSIATEAYESMFIRITDSNLRVKSTRVEPTSTVNNGDYRVGLTSTPSINGLRVSAGRQTNNIFTSLNFSYVNDTLWANTDGLMNVPVCLITDSTTFDSLQGILMYQWNVVKLTPRNNADAFNPRKHGCSPACAAPVSFSVSFTTTPPQQVEASWAAVTGAIAYRFSWQQVSPTVGPEKNIVTPNLSLSLPIPDSLQEGRYLFTLKTLCADNASNIKKDSLNIVVVSRSQLANNLSFTAFPSPAKQTLNIALPKENGNWQISLMNAMGATIQEQKVSLAGQTTYTISLDKVSAGFYWVQVIDLQEKTVGYQKIMVE
ncbi:MAG: T9SS type A sorting domain-containing protein [Bacteroidia bacterium]|nr:T9SS type A sorting domain-containing protein [Bacteroidia bacterium]